MASAAEREFGPQAPRLTPESPTLGPQEAHPLVDFFDSSFGLGFEKTDSSRKMHHRDLGYVSRAGNCDVILSPIGPVDDSLGTRKITIDKQNFLITVGRSSRNKAKGLLPDPRNAYFDSPVMSRLHAWLRCDDDGKVGFPDTRLLLQPHLSMIHTPINDPIDSPSCPHTSNTTFYSFPHLLTPSRTNLALEPQVLISDARSMHGTYLNDKRLEPSVCYPLETGSIVRFGNAVTRGSGMLSLVPNPSPRLRAFAKILEETFCPKQFTVEIVQKSTTSEIQHGYGLTSDELVLPDSPYSSEDEDDDVMITDVKPISKPDLERESWICASSSDTATIGRELLQEPSCSNVDISIIRNTTHVDLTVDPPMQQQTKPVMHPRISISELLAQERKEQSRQSSHSPASQGSSDGHPIVLYSDDEDDDSRPDIDDDASSSDAEPSSESAPTSPISARSSEATKASLPLPDVQSPNSPAVNTPLGPVTFLDELVSPEVKQAWTNTWKSPLFSPFSNLMRSPDGAITTPDSKQLDFASPLNISRDSITNLANRTKLAMEQVRKAEALRDRAYDFLRSRIEMQNLRDIYNPPKDTGADEAYPTPRVQDLDTGKTDSTIPIWVRNFGQGANVESKFEAEATSSMNDPAPAAESPCEDQGVEDWCSEEDISESAETRSPSPECKMVEDSEMSYGDDHERNYVPSRRDPACCLDDGLDYYSEEEESSEDEESSDADSDADMKEPFELEISSVEDNEMDYTREDDYLEDDNDGDTESQLSKEEETLPHTEEELHRSQTVKNAMSMENFFSPNDEPADEFDAVAAWCERAGDFPDPSGRLSPRLSTNLSRFEAPREPTPEPSAQPAMVPDASSDASLPACKKRKRADSEEAEECADIMDTVAEDILLSRKIAPLPSRSILRSRAGPSALGSPNAQRTIDEPSELAAEPEVEASDPTSEPEKKKPRVENTGGSWGSTLATAIAGALVGGVGVFAALVATASDM
ncbi:hypothetical protein Dda_8213 [Drechslerella dactyloides]|uniref:FHA domain-containing protein n=1 Tax=Drechslerella dactyloides TaxID=74499 RepID=A0AAD6IRP5_DREDA|nr:hypothetical protein Dda_8213 [Drechslerella dactyloides]